MLSDERIDRDHLNEDLNNTVSTRDDSNELSQEKSAGALGDYYVHPGMPELLRQAAAEGLVLLENNGVLPLNPEKRLSIFGRCQLDYFYVGYGSGGDVNPPYKVNLIDGLRANPTLRLNEELVATYRAFSDQPENQPEEGIWGQWPMNYEEMPVTAELVEAAKAESETAIVVIGRAAGEDRESILEPGSYYLTEAERTMLDLVTASFDEVIVILDCGNIMDLAWVEGYGDKISALIYAWQGGMESGNALADVLTGRLNFSGKLADSIARHYEDYPSSRSFGDAVYNNYEEDIYVGYRYFSTFANEKILYPFGYGLSYSQFNYELKSFERHEVGVLCEVEVTNTSQVPGQATVQLYYAAAQGLLGKPARELGAFQKSRVLGAAESETITLSISNYLLSSYDDLGKTKHKSAYILESGLYTFFLGEDVRQAVPVASFKQEETVVIEQLEPVLAVQEAFGRMRTGQLGEQQYEQDWEMLPATELDLKERILNALPEAIDANLAVDTPIHFDELVKDPTKLEAFILQLSDDELEALTRGQGGMNSPDGTEGNAGAYGGIIPSLKERGVPAVITTDGPAGIRLRRYNSLLPCGTAFACSWNPALIEAIHVKLGEEMKHYGSDVLLSPGMNIHRNPLCGRNFEYFSEDPLLTAKMAAAVVDGVESQGVSTCPKHFALNNQETNRNYNDSRVSERAAREIYLKPFEYVVKRAKPAHIMTSYNKINGVWAHYNYDLATTILREEWGFEGTILTDWWMRKDTSPEFPKIRDNAYRVRAQVDVLMPGGIVFEETWYQSDGSLLESLGEDEGLTRGELHRIAKTVLKGIIRLKS